MSLIENKDAGKKHGTELRCGDCIHFKTGPAHPNYGKLCSELGKKVFSPICPVYEPDVTALKSIGQGTLITLANVLQECSSKQTRILSHLLTRKARFEAAGLRFGQTLYFCLGMQYLSSIVSGKLIAVSRTGHELTLVSDMDGLQSTQATATVLRSSVMTEEQFLKLRKQLIQSDRVLEPATRGHPSTLEQLRMTKKQIRAYHATLVKNPNEYEPPSIDSVPIEWLDKRVMETLGKDKKKRKGTELKVSKKRKDGSVTIRMGR